jgi:predicted nucleic acid-binding protein
LDVQVAQALRRYYRLGELSAARGREALADLQEMDITRHEHLLVIERAWHLRDRVTAYDAMYLALAELLDAPLVTFDAKLARAAGRSVEIELFER